MKNKIRQFYEKHIVEDLEKKYEDEVEAEEEKKDEEVKNEEENKDKEVDKNNEVNRSKEVKKKKFVVWKLSSIILAFFLVWALSGVMVYFLLSQWSDRGTFGDMFGAVNALFSAFAFAGLVYTLYVQRYELTLTRKELELQRKEVKRNGDQLEEQKNVMLQQSFENTFFKMIELHHNVLNSLTESSGHKGRLVVYSIRNSLTNKVMNTRSHYELKEKIAHFMKNESGRQIIQYIDNFYCVLLLISKHCEQTSKNVKESDYTTIALSQLSDDDKYIMFYALGFREETRLILEQFISLDELNSKDIKHSDWMRGMN